MASRSTGWRLQPSASVTAGTRMRSSAAQEGRVQAGEVVFSQKERGGGALACGLKGARDQGGGGKGRDTHPQRLDFMAGRRPGPSEQGGPAAQQAIQGGQTGTSGNARRHAQARGGWAQGV